MNQRRGLDDESEELNVRDPCELLGLSPSGYDYEASPKTAENLDAFPPARTNHCSQEQIP